MKNFLFTFTWFSVRPQTFSSFNPDVLVKLRRIAFFVVVVVILFSCRHASDKFQESVSRSRTLRFFLSCLSLKYDHFRCGYVPVNQNKLTMCLQFHQISSHSTCLKLFLWLVHLCEVFENCSIRWRNDWNHFYETTDHLQQFRTDKFRTVKKSLRPTKVPRRQEDQ